MASHRGECTSVLLWIFVAAAMLRLEVVLSADMQSCMMMGSPCYRRVIRCPMECPFTRPMHPNAKACVLDCNSPKCEAVCKGRKPNCNNMGSGCQDPRFLGGDGTVFYFHGRKGEHFSLISDASFQINARFIGLRPAGRTRDFTWIQALGFMFGSRTFTVEAARAAQWDNAVDHLRFSYNGEPVSVPEGHLSEWRSPDDKLMVARTGTRNSVVVTVEGIAEVSVNVVPVTEEDDRVHKYHVPSNDTLAHLEVQFGFFGLSAKVEGVLGRTYRPDYVSTAKAGVAMPVVGGEAKYRTSSLLSPDCKACLFSPVLAE